MRAALAVLGVLVATNAHARVHTRTFEVEGLALLDGQLVAATRGGVEVFDLTTLARRVYTTDDGLADNHVRRVSVEQGRLVARTAGARCELHERFVCAPAPPLPADVPASAPRFAGARETARLSQGGHTFVATAGAGVWMDGRRLTPDGQICSNHITAIEPFAGTTYFASFDSGLCRREPDGSFRRVGDELRMVNDLVATRHGLFVAASEGLFVSRDGLVFDRVGAERGFNDLAAGGGFVYATTPGSLWRIAPGTRKTRTWWKPGGARSLQAVAVRGRTVYLASEDRGVIALERDLVTIHDRAAGLPSSWVLDVAVAGTLTYAATLRHGLVTLDGARLLADAWLLHVSVDRDTVWVGTQGGAFAVRDGVATRLGGEPHANVHVVRRLGKTLWLGTEGGLLEKSDM